ncbi:MAG: copper resistance protein CopC [Mycobacterium sp.]|nr:copper resistance protein CopC [Mycobacterium sp.]
MKVIPSLAVSAALAAAALINPGPASAHDWLTNSTPAENSTGPAPTQVSMTFNEPVTHAQAWIVGPDGATWSAGPLNGSGANYTIAMKPSPPPGLYVVHWHNTAADGDDIYNGWSFTIS